jgi:hypothetical protein
MAAEFGTFAHSRSGEPERSIVVVISTVAATLFAVFPMALNSSIPPPILAHFISLALSAIPQINSRAAWTDVDALRSGWNRREERAGENQPCGEQAVCENLVHRCLRDLRPNML